MGKIKCFKCNGKGRTGISVSPLAGLLTGGLAFLADSDEVCDACDGKGYLEE